MTINRTILKNFLLQTIKNIKMLTRKNIIKSGLQLIFLLFIAKTVVAQQNIQPQIYDGVSRSLKVSLFYDNFQNNNNNWNLKSSGTKIVQIKDKALSIETLHDKIGLLQEVQINENENFEIEARIKFVSGNSKRAFGIQWGSSPENNRYYSFIINPNQQFAISKYSGAYINFKHGIDNNIKSNDYNIITIRKIDNMLYFFLNKKLVHSMEYRMFYGNQFGIQSAGENHILIDYFKIDQLVFVSENKTPNITLSQPNRDRPYVEISETAEYIKLKGKVEDEGKIESIEINNTNYELDSDGTFDISFKLKPNVHRILLKVIDPQMLESTEYITLKRTKSIIKPTPSETVELNVEGKYYALIIGVNDYMNGSINDLNGPIADAERLYKILIRKYTFEVGDVQFLKNPKRIELIIALDDISNKITDKDNLLIFYAGHGYWDEAREFGYWLPADATTQNTANWFRNSTLKSYIATIKAKNILLISDACFAGSIFRTRSISDVSKEVADLYNIPARKAMTSGNLKEVPDNSVFLKYLSMNLLNNSKKFISAEELFKKFQQAVINNTNNEPQYGTIKNTGDQGGDFIFIKR